MNKLNIENSYQLEISLLTSWSAPIGRLEYRHRRSPVIGCLDSTHSHNVVGPVKHQHKKYPGIFGYFIPYTGIITANDGA